MDETPQSPLSFISREPFAFGRVLSDGAGDYSVTRCSEVEPGRYLIELQVDTMYHHDIDGNRL